MVDRFAVGGLAVAALVCLGGATPAWAQAGGLSKIDNYDFEGS